MVLRTLARLAVIVTALALITPLAGPTSHAQDLPEAVDLKPLSGSAWARQHPGQLPFERCVLSEAPPSAEAPQSAEPSAPSQASILPGYLTCWAPKVSLAFRIPVDIRAVDPAGAARLASQVLWNREIAVEPLAGRIVDDLFGVFQGWQAALGVGVGGRMQRVRNSAGVQLTSIDGGIQFGLMVGQVRLELLPRERIGSEECSSDPYLLVGDTRALRSPALCGIYGEPVHFGELGRAEFKAVR